jgi:hypothetical protein
MVLERRINSTRFGVVGRGDVLYPGLRFACAGVIQIEDLTVFVVQTESYGLYVFNFEHRVLLLTRFLSLFR